MKNLLKHILTAALLLVISAIIGYIAKALYQARYLEHPEPLEEKPAITHPRQLTNEEVRSRVKKTTYEFSKDHHLNGTIVVSRNGEVIHTQHFGFADQRENTYIDDNTQYLIGSITKQVTAAGLLKALYDKALATGSKDIKKQISLELHSPLSHYLPAEHKVWAGSIPQWAEKVTLHHLLTHTSGIVNFSSMPSVKFLAVFPPKPPRLVSFFKDETPEFEPGSRYSYNNSGYVLLGLVIEAITGEHLEAYLEKAFFAPLGMHSTFLPLRGTALELKQTNPRAQHLARAYEFDPYSSKPILTELNFYSPMELPLGAGGLVSTAQDVLKWNEALHSGKAIPPLLVKLMTTPYAQTDKLGERFYGYGIIIDHDKTLGQLYEHEGNIPGFRSKLTYVPRLNTSIICLTNVIPKWTKLLPELGDIQNNLPEGLSEMEKWEKIEAIIMERHPNFSKNQELNDFIEINKVILKTLAGLS